MRTVLAPTNRIRKILTIPLILLIPSKTSSESKRLRIALRRPTRLLFEKDPCQIEAAHRELPPFFLANQLQSRLATELFDDWFNGKIALPSIGRVKSKNIPSDELPSEPDFPALKVGYFGKTKMGNYTLGFADSIGARFKNNDVLHSRWQAHPTTITICKNITILNKSMQ